MTCSAESVNVDLVRRRADVVVVRVGLAVLAIGMAIVGAHNPLDVVCGAALGLAIGGSVNLLLGIPEPRQ
jgi:membrane-associated phospholipid phosphatase